MLKNFGYREVETSDAGTMLVYFRSKGKMDNDLFVRYTVGENNTLGNLFWTDSVMRYGYEFFGDALGLMQHITRISTRDQ